MLSTTIVAIIASFIGLLCLLKLKEYIPKRLLNASDELCKELMDYILEQGNFGHKRTDDKATKVLTRYRTPIAFIKGMQRKGLEEWRLCKTHRILRPFAWMYTVVEGIKYLSKRGLSKMKSDRVEQKKWQKMFDQLYG